MARDTPGPRVLLSVPNEIEADLIVEALREQGVAATAVGGHLAGFQAAAPGQVSVLVEGRHFQQAVEALDQIRAGWSELDWSHVDVGADADAALDPPAEPAARRTPGGEADPAARRSPACLPWALVIAVVIGQGLMLCRSWTEACVVLAGLALVIGSYAAASARRKER